MGNWFSREIGIEVGSEAEIGVGVSEIGETCGWGDEVYVELSATLRSGKWERGKN